MAVNRLAQYASTSQLSTHTITLSAAASKNTLWVMAHAPAVMSITGDNASWVQVASKVDATDFKIWRLASTAFGGSKTSVTITTSVAANVVAVVWEDNVDSAVTPYANWGGGTDNGTQWFTPANSSFSGMTTAFALYSAIWSSGVNASTADLGPYTLGFTELGDSGYNSGGGSLGTLRAWIASASLTSLSNGTTVGATFNGWVGAALGTDTGVLAYKALPDSPTPVANAGPDQSVQTNDVVTLSGSGTVTGDTITGYTWRQISGTAVTLSSTTAQNPTFTAPSTAGTLVFGMTCHTATTTSAEDTVSITVSAPVTITYGTTVALENAQTTGVTARTVWHDGVNQIDMPGFVRRSYYLPGQTAQFSVDFNAAFTADIYRLGWYGGAANGARKVATVTGNATNQPAATTIANSNGGVDCSNWSVNVSWAIPSDATPGWYYLQLKASTGTAKGHILFCVSDKNAKKSIVVMSSDATWGGAYNYYGGKTAVTSGKSLYGSGGPIGGTGGAADRCMAVSMDRPLVTREGVPQTYFFDGEYPFLRFVERMGIDVAYTTNEQVDADPTILDGRSMIITVGHNEYISQTIFDKFVSLANTTSTKFVNLAGNDFFWRTRYGTTSGWNDYSNSTKGRVIWCRKDTLDGPPLPGGGAHVGGTYYDSNEWLGTWQDTRPTWAGRRPSSVMWGDRFIANGVRNDEITVGFAYKSKPIWRGITAVQNLTSGQSVGLGVGTLGMEWDEPEPNTAIGPGRTNLSQTSITISSGLSDVDGANYNVSGTANHSLLMLRTAGGGYIFNANTTQWGWGLDDFHDRGTAVANNTARQATLNVMYDLGATADSTSVTNATLAVPTAQSPETYGIPVNLLPPPSTATGSAIAPAVTAGSSATTAAPISTASASAAVPVVQGVVYVPPADSQNLVVTGAAQAVGQAIAPVVGTSNTASPGGEATGDFVYNTDVTLDDLIEEVLLQLHGFSVKGDQLTTLAGPVSATATTLVVDDVNEISRGVIEIDNELIRVQTVDRTSGTVTILPRGRGWRQTVPSTHTAGATVVMSPLVPRVAIGQAINDTILSLYPDIFGVGTVEFAYTGAPAVSFQLPTAAESVLSVRYKDTEGNWQKVRTWELENGMSINSFLTGKSIRILDVPAGMTVQVVYGRIPTALTTAASLFSTTGLASSHRDLVVLGAQARLIPALDVARLSVRTVQADELDQPIQLGSAFNLAKEMQARFVARVRQEKSILQSRYPAPVHFTR